MENFWHACLVIVRLSRGKLGISDWRLALSADGMKALGGIDPINDPGFYIFEPITGYYRYTPADLGK
jgi:hypothetical protein